MKLKFYNTIPGVNKLMPIIPANSYKFDWKSQAAAHFQTIKNQVGMGPNISMSRCPGINTLHQTGWLLRTWQDIFIENDGDAFSWRTPTDQKAITGEDTIQFHNRELYSFFKNWPYHTLKTILKINTGWTAIVPNGYSLYQIPVPYADENRFTALPGIYTNEYGLSHLNVPIHWHEINKATTIPAGTPLVQLILFKNIETECEILSSPDTELEKINTIVYNSYFTRDYKKIKEFFNNLFK